MSIKLFILGCPGSGKSTAYRHIEEVIKNRYASWTTSRYNDYKILYEMFHFEELYLKENKNRKFKSREHNGFDVRDFTVLDTSLKQLEKRVREIMSIKDELIVIEFARQDYIEALNLFSSSFLKDAYFLFIEADLQTCIQRVNKRVNNPPSLDNHFVSKYIFNKYYSKQIIPPGIITKKGDSIDKSRIKVINSQGAIEDFNIKVEEFVTHIITAEDSSYAIPAIPNIKTPSKLSRTYILESLRRSHIPKSVSRFLHSDNKATLQH
jgi:thymidylate kinase